MLSLIDSGIATAEVVRNEIDRIGLETNSAVPGNLEVYVSDIPTTFKQVAELFLGRTINEVVKVDIEELHKI